MDDKIIATFCLCDDLLKAKHHQEDHQCQMNDAEIMTTAFIASLFFRGHHESARAMLKQQGYIPHMLSKSQFNRRLHRIKELFIILFNLLGKTWKTLNTDAIYVIDSLPIAVCDNIRIRRSKIYSDENFRGYQASKKRYFYGLKIHLMVTQDGQSVVGYINIITNINIIILLYLSVLIHRLLYSKKDYKKDAKSVFFFLGGLAAASKLVRSCL